jgi:hypothetical protein
MVRFGVNFPLEKNSTTRSKPRWDKELRAENTKKTYSRFF